MLEGFRENFGSWQSRPAARYPSVAINQNNCRPRNDVIELEHLSIWVAQYRESITISGGERTNNRLVFVGDGKDSQPLPLQRVYLRHLPAARRTPGCPKIEQNWPAAQFLQAVAAAIQIFQREVIQFLDFMFEFLQQSIDTGISTHLLGNSAAERFQRRLRLNLTRKAT